MTMEYHIVYQVALEIGTGQSPRMGEEVAYNTAQLANKLNFLLNRNEDILGVYIIRNNFGNANETRQLRRFKNYLEDLVEGGKLEW